MSVVPLLSELQRLDVQVRLEGDQLRCSAPRGVLTDELLEQIRSHKPEIVDFLNSARAATEKQTAIVPIQPKGSQVPIFGVPGHNGDVFCYVPLAKHLGNDQPLFGLQPPGLDETSTPKTRVEDLAAYFADQIRATKPDGAVIIAGFCAGGGTGLELAQQLQESGQQVEMLVLFGSPFPKAYRFWSMTRIRFMNVPVWMAGHWRALRERSLLERIRYVVDKCRSRFDWSRSAPDAVADAVLARREHVESVTLNALKRYSPRPFGGRIVQMLPSEQWRTIGDNSDWWKAAGAHYSEYVGPESCDGNNILREPHVSIFADFFRSERS